MIHLYLHDYGEFSGLNSLVGDPLVAVHPLSIHMRKEVGPDKVAPYADEICISGLVSESQGEALKRHDYSIGYYDYPFYRRSLRHNLYLEDCDEIWVYTNKCKRALNGLGHSNVHVMGNVGHSNWEKDLSPVNYEYNLWIGQHGFLYKDTFKSFMKTLKNPKDLLVYPHPATDGEFERSLGAITLEGADLGNAVLNAKTVYTWESTAIMGAYIHGVPTVCYEIDKDDHDNVFLKNGAAYEATEPTVESIYNSKLPPLGMDFGIPEDPAEAIEERLHCL